jgi:hypothetical protein
MFERILIHFNNLSETGTSTSVFEYALGLQDKKYQVSVAYEANSPNNVTRVVDLFSQKFELYPYREFYDLNRIARRNFDIGYFLKAGAIDGKKLSAVPSGIHAVFKHYEPHGERYCYVSKWLRDEMEYKRREITKMKSLKVLLKGGKLNFNEPLEYVPHCVDLPEPNENLRKAWGIPADAIVGIRLGGMEKFDIEWVKETVLQVLKRKKNYYFIFINTQKFASHPRIIFLPAIIIKQHKVNALSSADFFLHARIMGESFGMAILEAMRLRIPVFAWEGGRDLHHTQLLSKDSLYKSPSDLLEKLIKVKEYKDIVFNYEKSLEFTKEKVIDKFERVFIRSILDR